ncbi:MAG: hypothetical protein SGBAC_008670 [Bacillariaceae sp.]
MQNNEVVAATEREKKQQQTPSAASAALMGDTKDTSEPQESGSKDKSLNVEVVNRNTRPSTTSSLGEAQNEGKLQGKFNIGKREETDLSADDKLINVRGVGEIQNSNEQQQQPVQKGERGTKPSDIIHVKGQEDAQVNTTGKGEDTDLSADDTMDIAHDVRQSQNLPEYVQQRQTVLKGTRETKLSESIKVRGAEDGKINIGKGEETGLATDDTMGVAHGVRQIQNSPDCVQGKGETESPETIKARGLEGDKSTIGEGEDKDLAADCKLSNIQGVRKIQNSPENVQQEQQIQKGTRETESSENIKARGQEDDQKNSIIGKGGKSDLSADDSMDIAQSVNRNPRGSGTTKQILMRRKNQSNRPGAEDVKQDIVEENKVGKDISSAVESRDSESGILKRSETVVKGGQQQAEIHKGVTNNPSAESVPRKEKREREPLQSPARSSPQGLRSNEGDRMREAAAMPHRAESILLQGQDLEHYERAREQYRRAQGEASRMYHLLPAEAKALVQARGLGQPMHNVPTTSDAALRNHPPPTQEVEAGALRAVAESHRLGPSIRGVPIAPTGALRSHPSEAEALRVVAQPPFLRPSAVPMPAMSGMALNNPSRSIAAHRRATATPRSMGGEAPASADSSVSEELPSGAHPSMDEEMSDRARRERKNAQSRIRTNRLRKQLEEIRAKRQEERTAEEQRLFNESEARRQKKNLRSRARATEKKEAIERILSIPPEERSKDDIAYYNLVIGQKKRKIEGDKLRRVRIKDLGLPSGQKAPGVPARGPLPPEYQYMSEDSDQMKKQPFQGPHPEA